MTCGNQVTITTHQDRFASWGRYIEIEVHDLAGETEARVLVTYDLGSDAATLRAHRLANTIAATLAHGRPIMRVSK